MLATETTDAELAEEQQQADLLGWQEEALIRELETRRRRGQASIVIHRLLFNQDVLVRRAQGLLKSRDALITTDAFQYLGHALITWVRRVVLDALAIDLEIRHLSGRTTTPEVGLEPVYQALLLNKVAPDLVEALQDADAKRRERIRQREQQKSARRARSSAEHASDGQSSSFGEDGAWTTDQESADGDDQLRAGQAKRARIGAPYAPEEEVPAYYRQFLGTAAGGQGNTAGGRGGEEVAAAGLLSKFAHLIAGLYPTKEDEKAERDKGKGEGEDGSDDGEDASGDGEDASGEGEDESGDGEDESDDPFINDSDDDL